MTGSSYNWILSQPDLATVINSDAEVMRNYCSCSLSGMCTSCDKNNGLVPLERGWANLETTLAAATVLSMAPRINGVALSRGGWHG